VSRDCVAQFEWDLAEVDLVSIWKLTGICAHPSDWHFDLILIVEGIEGDFDG
jgi:hypothetical protein